MAKFLQETTVWKDAHGDVLQAQYMNHIYLVNDNNQMIGYIPYNYEEDLDKLRIFNKAMSLYKSRRTFKERKELMPKFRILHPTQYEILVSNQ